MERLAAPRAALLPAFQESVPADLSRVLSEGGPALEQLILHHQLAPLWHAQTNAAIFRDARQRAAQLYMKQQASLHEVDRLFTQGGIRYAVIKGAGVRELVYDDPALRFCSDIDLLVSSGQRVDAARILVGAGYRLDVKASLVSHEVVLTNGPVMIDLHWDILRPGRTRIPVTDGMLERRHRPGGWWILSDVDALFLMLVHGAVSKYVTANMGLHRVSELALWWQRRSVDWPAVHRNLDACGLKTGAWAVLSWVRLLSPSAFAARLDDSIASVRPGWLKGAYVKFWLDHDLATRFSRIHSVRQLAFSTVMHDQWTDAWHGLSEWRRTRRTSSSDVAAFRDLVG